jgi:ribonuclease/clavin/mitogillin
LNQSLTRAILNIRLYETPGHTTDHLVLHLEQDNTLFSGDCILGEGSTVFEDLLSYLASLQRIRQIAPCRIFPGHGPVIENPPDKIQEYITHRLQREQQLLDALPTTLQSATTANDLLQKLYPDLSDTLKWGALGNIFKHLIKLVKESRVEVIGRLPTNRDEFENNEPPKFWKRS